MRRIRVLIERIEPQKHGEPEQTTRLGSMITEVPNHHEAAKAGSPEVGTGVPTSHKIKAALNAAADIVGGA